MLSIITGRALSGKSQGIMNRIGELLKDGDKKVILLVPEQFSFSSERAVLKSFGDTLAQRVSVMTFTRLCDESERKNGKLCAKTLTESDKLILMSRALSDCRLELRLWSGYVHSLSFAKSMVAAIDEFKQNAVSVCELESVAETIGGNLADKLFDTVTIWESYNMLIADRFIDPEDRLQRLYSALLEDNFFMGTEVFIDSFTGFTGMQYKIIERIISSAAGVTVALTDDPADTRLWGIFKNIKDTKSRIIRIAEKYSVNIGNNAHYSDNYYQNNDLKALEELMYSGKTSFEDKIENIILCRAQTVYDEAEFAARNIRKIIRQSSARLSDFLIVARDIDSYEYPLKFALERNGISCFIDRRLPLGNQSVAVIVLSAIEALKGYSTEKILKFLKSGIAILSEEEISLLENYTYIWNINGAAWFKEWQMNPSGLKNDINEQERTRLSEINSLRLRVIAPLEGFKSHFCGNAQDMASAIVGLLEETNAAKALCELANYYEAQGNQIYAESCRRSWKAMMQLLDSMVKCFPSSEISVSSFCDCLKSAVGSADVGVVPQNIDEVTFTSPDRIGNHHPKYVFILGANQGVFPKSSVNSGIFAANEREKLIKLNIDIPDNILKSSIEEEFAVYESVCAAREKLFISSSVTLPSGSKSEPSAFLNTIAKSFNIKPLSEPDVLCCDNLPETADSAFSEYCRIKLSDTADAKTLQSALFDSGYEAKVKMIDGTDARLDAVISPDTAKTLFGVSLKMSPTAFESYNGCPFKYFCSYGLGVKALDTADFNPAQTGTLVHEVLERIVSQYGRSLCELSDEEIKAEVDLKVEHYLSSIKGFKEIQTGAMSYQLYLVRQSLYYVVGRLRDEFAQSQFEPVHCELRFSENGNLPSIKIPLEGGEILLTGVVDRVDKWNGYIRIVDYKTGERNFKLPDILYGQNMQMILYLYALKNNPEFGGKPAGVFYMRAHRQKNSTPAKRRMNGLLPANAELVCAMEQNNKGEFVPRLNPQKLSDSFIEEEKFDKLFEYVNDKIKNTGNKILSGDITVDPLDSLDGKACKYCDFAAVCRIGEAEHRTVASMSNSEVMDEIERGEKHGI